MSVVVEGTDQGKSLTKKWMERSLWGKKRLFVVVVLGKWPNCEFLVVVLVDIEVDFVVEVCVRKMSVCMLLHEFADQVQVVCQDW